MAEFDFSALSADDTEMPSTAHGGRTRKIQHNPFVEFLSDSYQRDVAKAVKIPNEQVKQTEYLIRQAATDLGIGVRLHFSLSKEEREKAAKNKHVTITFQGKEKRTYNGRSRSAAVAVEPASE